MPTTSFLDLPPELRNNIYEHLKADWLAQTSKRCGPIWITHFKDPDIHILHPITQVNRQCRAEATGLLFQGVTVKFDMIYPEDYNTCEDWIDIMDESAIEAAAGFEIMSGCGCRGESLIQVTIKEAAVPGEVFDATVRLVDEFKTDWESCWSEEQLESIEEELAELLSEVRPALGCLRMDKGTLMEALNHCVAHDHPQ